MSNNFLKFSLEQIRQNGAYMSWLEERRLEWSPLVASKLSLLLQGYTFIIITDEQRAWYEEYFLSQINKKATRPMLPFISLKGICNKNYNTQEEIALLNDLLSISFPNGYVYFYIGKNSDPKAQIAKSKEDSLLWLFDEQLQNSFYLSSLDKDLDYKLISLYKIFDKSLDAVLFSKVEI
ncbi:HobA family DNA replication regulator [Campylobacter peloridis]|uniref:DnaA-binding chromosome replication initiation factor n=1 Tax=Campylobacter peloridis TaxID=488546 RepID=A0A5C7DP37_9BACT|nr:HobA family DNA replication regulator [Campylobacter peloridis]AJC84562.1 DnaA-binding chromosome replication initiation factor [Campylobacter peloridis LMG 23910]MBX1885794.1 DnaA-binding chromosome replication initiation factor [Campylobacter peloridis]MBX2079392.1 DnaA-binding chromosome replication initiation factor [Campylobacter peloridis]QOQ88632.1 DnaA-binding chromosome replication initiation factor [Campylobacter peloridis]TXE81568.1 DnaA-binding chromosome replication initiation 